MIKSLRNLYRKIIPVRKPIWVRFSSDHDWTAGESVNGLYIGEWWWIEFPLKLNDDGTGTMLFPGLKGTGKPYPGFKWKPRKGETK